MDEIKLKAQSAPPFFVFYVFRRFRFMVNLGFYSNFKDTEVNFYTVRIGSRCLPFCQWLHISGLNGLM